MALLSYKTLGYPELGYTLNIAIGLLYGLNYDIWRRLTEQNENSPNPRSWTWRVLDF